MSVAFKLGQLVGGTAARVVHYGEVSFEATDQAGKDFVQGTKSQYVGDRAKLLEQRAAAMQKRAEEMRLKAQPVVAPAPVVTVAVEA